MSDDFFGCNLSDEAIFTQAAAQQYAANNVLRKSSIMDSVVGLKAANAHLTRRVAELEAEKSRRDIVAQNITPAADLPTLGTEAWREIAMAYQFEIEDLTRQLAAHALAHAEQMEGARGGDYAQVRAELSNMCEIAIDQAKRIASLDTALKISETRTYIAEGRVAELEMRVTPATQPTAAQQTAGDVKAAPERRPDGTLKPMARAWEAPRRLNDPRMVGR